MLEKIKTLIITIIQFIQATNIIRRALPIKSEKGLIIIPCDPESAIGSRGDEAMITGVICNFRERYPNENISIVVQGEIARNYIENAKLDDNIDVIESWNFAYPFERIYRSVINKCPREVVLIGADCIDGAYAPNLSLELLLLYAACKKASIPTYFTGFSYNQRPYWFINKAIKWLGLKDLPLRDNVSLARYQSKTGMQGALVADVAFMLKPNTDFKDYQFVRDWVSDRHENQDIVIAFNFHPMLKQYNSLAEIEQDAHIMARNIFTILNHNDNVSILLLPHDDRNRINDGTMLNVIYNDLKVDFNADRVRYLKEVPRASQLKAIASLIDGVVSSRMHLAIAALGSGVPVMVADYQGKFEGLFNHFNFPHEYILPVSKFCSREFTSYTNQFIAQLSELRSTVCSNLPQVLKLAEKNFHQL